MKGLLALAVSFALTACAGSSGPGSSAGQRLKPVANPSEIVAAELALARAARDGGQWTALRKQAADGALIFGQQGAFEAKSWLGKQQNPAIAMSWQPLAVWSSCDGSLAVTQVSFTDPNTNVQGLGHTVWQRERNGAYRWVFRFEWPTGTGAPKPEMIAAEVARCGPVTAVSAEGPGLRRSADGTLAWSFAFTGDGGRQFNVWTPGGEGLMTPVIQVFIPRTD